MKYDYRVLIQVVNGSGTLLQQNDYVFFGGPEVRTKAKAVAQGLSACVSKCVEDYDLAHPGARSTDTPPGPEE